MDIINPLLIEIENRFFTKGLSVFKSLMDKPDSHWTCEIKGLISEVVGMKPSGTIFTHLEAKDFQKRIFTQLKKDRRFIEFEYLLDLIVLDKKEIQPSLGVEIEWSTMRHGYKRIQEYVDVLNSIWGIDIDRNTIPQEYPVRIYDILYDFSRMLMVDPKAMIMISWSYYPSKEYNNLLDLMGKMIRKVPKVNNIDKRLLLFLFTRERRSKRWYLYSYDCNGIWKNKYRKIVPI